MFKLFSTHIYIHGGKGGVYYQNFMTVHVDESSRAIIMILIIPCLGEIFTLSWIITRYNKGQVLLQVLMWLYACCNRRNVAYVYTRHSVSWGSVRKNLTEERGLWFNNLPQPTVFFWTAPQLTRPWNRLEWVIKKKCSLAYAHQDIDQGHVQ